MTWNGTWADGTCTRTPSPDEPRVEFPEGSSLGSPLDPEDGLEVAVADGLGEGVASFGWGVSGTGGPPGPPPPPGAAVAPGPGFAVGAAVGRGVGGGVGGGGAGVLGAPVTTTAGASPGIGCPWHWNAVVAEEVHAQVPAWVGVAVTRNRTRCSKSSRSSPAAFAWTALLPTWAIDQTPSVESIIATLLIENDAGTLTLTQPILPPCSTFVAVSVNAVEAPRLAVDGAMLSVHDAAALTVIGPATLSASAASTSTTGAHRRSADIRRPSIAGAR